MKVAAVSPVEPGDSGSSQAVKAQLRLREMILAGELPGGARIAEVAISEQLGVSRTPVRSALMRLEQEGLLEALPNGGYAVRTFSERDVADAIELRGTLEGLVARLAAERGAAPVVLREARACLARIDELLREPALDDAAFSRYVTHNEKFHALLCEMAGSPVIAQQLERVINLPFASPSGFVIVQANSPAARDMLVIAQDQDSWTVQVALSTFLTAQSIDVGQLFLAAAVSVTPLVIVFVALQRLLVRGVTETGIKG